MIDDICFDNKYQTNKKGEPSLPSVSPRQDKCGDFSKGGVNQSEPGEWTTLRLMFKVTNNLKVTEYVFFLRVKKGNLNPYNLPCFVRVEFYNL